MRSERRTLPSVLVVELEHRKLERVYAATFFSTR
jgi:hypothetical protein